MSDSTCVWEVGALPARSVTRLVISDWGWVWDARARPAVRFPKVIPRSSVGSSLSQIARMSSDEGYSNRSYNYQGHQGRKEETQSPDNGQKWKRKVGIKHEGRTQNYFSNWW